MSSPVVVIGGAGGTEVEYADLHTTARVLDEAALDLLGTANEARSVVTDAGLLASAALDPAGFARVEATVLAAVAGPHGLLPAAARIEGHGLALRAAVARYTVADRLGDGWREVRQWAEGTAFALALPALPLVLASPAVIGPLLTVRGDDVDRLLAEHPGIAEDVAGAAPAFLDGLLALAVGPVGMITEHVSSAVGRGHVVSSLEDAADMLASLYPAGSARVVGRGVDTTAPGAPHNVSDLLGALEHRDDLATGDAQGEIDVRRITRTLADGQVVTSWVVDLPGTKHWQFDPRHREHLNDLATNLTTMAGTPTARIDGLTEAMTRAGVQPGEPVMLVGHSQGGLVAMRAAEEYSRDGRFTVTHVVTAGSPIARMDVPASVSVLALENRFDLVPQLDGRPPPAEANRVTVVFDAQHHDIGRNHAIAATYLPAGGLVDADVGDPSLAAWRAGAGAFLAPDDASVQTRTTVWDIRNG